MRFPRPDDPELMAAIQRYVNAGPADRPGRYLKLLHGNALSISGEDRSQFELALGRDARQIADRDLSTLLDSEVVYSGQGYCLALARFETSADADILCAYLDKYLPQFDRYYDQHWAIGALLHLDERLRRKYADRFLAPGGLWDKSATSRNDPAEQHRRLARMCGLADDCMRAASVG